MTGAGVTPGYAAMPLPAAPWEYETIWRTQPQVRTVIGFLARNIAQLGIHTFRRVSDTDRERLTDHPLAQLLASPMPGMTTYRFVERIVSDVALYDSWYGIKLKLNGKLQLLPVPPSLIRPYGGNWIRPDHYETAGGKDFAVEDVVHIHGYAPDNLTVGSSPIESLRELLLESSEAARQRSQMWKGGARLTGVLQRPEDAPEWGEKEKKRFREMWRTFSQGGGAEGGTPILEDGMTYQAVGFNPEQAQYIESRKLTREEVSAAYFIPPPLIGILDHATYSNIKEQHAHLYQDTLGPWMVMLQQEILAQILPDLPGNNSDVYAEFNIDAKLRGSFEEQAVAASTATGRPWMTVNETRARNNLSAIEGGDSLITPMNVTEGGLASPRDTAPDPAALPKARGLALAKSSTRPEALGDFDAEQDSLIAAMEAWSESQMKKLLQAAGAKADGMPDLVALWAAGEDDRLAQLTALLASHGYSLAQVGAWEVLDKWNPEAAGWTPDVMLAWILAAAETHASAHEEAATEAVAAVQEEGGDGWKAALVVAAASWVTSAALRSGTVSTELRSFGGHDAASATGLGKKTWRAGGRNPRVTHKALDGETVSLGDVFGNGCRWPGDGMAKPKEFINCKCHLDYGR
ncbi:phage portal protein [Streptomyces virginiae]|uniref:phage portal protein n=1 Tax=Streptomyces virginiae TaxID=1961 RepID=UPI0036AB0BE8